MDAVDGVVPEGDEREEDLTEVKITFRSESTTLEVSIIKKKILR